MTNDQIKSVCSLSQLPVHGASVLDLFTVQQQFQPILYVLTQGMKTICQCITFPIKADI